MRVLGKNKFKGLTCDADSESQGPMPRGLYIHVLPVRACVHFGHKTRNTVSNHDHMRLLNSIHEWSDYPNMKLLWRKSRESRRTLLSLLRHVLPIDERNCSFTMSVAKRHGAWDPHQQIVNTLVSLCRKLIGQIKHVYKETVNFAERDNADLTSVKSNWNG